MLTFPIIFILNVILIKSIFTSSEIEDKLQNIKNLPKLHLYPNVIQLENSTYWKYVLKSPRPYQLIILFSTTNYQRCPECIKVNKAFSKVATSFENFDTPNETIVFTFLDVLENLHLATLHEMNSIPYVASLSSKSLTKKDSKVLFRSEELMDPNTFAKIIGNDDILIQKMLEWANLKTNMKVRIVYSSSSMQLPKIAGFFFLVIISLRLLIALSNILKTFPALIPIGGLFIFFVSIAGSFYCLQHKSPLFGWDSKFQKSIIIDQNSRGQFIFEGFLTSGLNIVFAILLYYLPRAIRSKLQSKNIWFRYLLYFFIMFATLGTLNFYFQVYKLKYPYINISFLPPTNYISGPLKLDRRTSF